MTKDMRQIKHQMEREALKHFAKTMGLYATAAQIRAAAKQAIHLSVQQALRNIKESE